MAWNTIFKDMTGVFTSINNYNNAVINITYGRNFAYNPYGDNVQLNFADFPQITLNKWNAPVGVNNAITLIRIPLYDSNGEIQYYIENKYYCDSIDSSYYQIDWYMYDKYNNVITSKRCTFMARSGDNIQLGFGIVAGDNLLGCCVIGQANNISGWDLNAGTFDKWVAICDMQYIRNRYNSQPSEEEISPEYGLPSKEGGYTGGTFDDSSDTIAIPPAPTMGVTSAGFINVYSPTQGELNQFGAELFPDLSFTPVSQGGTPSSVTDALVAMAQVLVDFGNQIPQIIDMYINANLINYVIDCHILPVAPTTAGNAPLKVGFKTFSQSPLKVSSDYVDFDCGSINVGEYYANFADYSPYTSAKLYLPFVGFMDIAPEYWQSGTLSVKYRFNVIDGSFVAYVKSTSSKSKLSDTVIAQFGGNACVHIPITGLNYASMVSGIVSAVSPLLPSSKSGAGTADTLVNSANTIASAKPTMQQSNGYNATTSFLTVRVPYLLIERSVSNFSRNFAEENGIPSNITTSFAGLSGFTKATMLHLDGIAGATDDDLNEIAQLLSEGIIL